MKDMDMKDTKQSRINALQLWAMDFFKEEKLEWVLQPCPASILFA